MSELPFDWRFETETSDSNAIESTLNPDAQEFVPASEQKEDNWKDMSAGEEMAYSDLMYNETYWDNDERQMGKYENEYWEINNNYGLMTEEAMKTIEQERMKNEKQREEEMESYKIELNGEKEKKKQKYLEQHFSLKRGKEESNVWSDTKKWNWSKKSESNDKDSTNWDEWTPKTTVCQFLSNGFCSYGNRCRYRHVDVHMGVEKTDPYLTCVLCHETVPWEDVLTDYNNNYNNNNKHFQHCKEIEWRKKEFQKSKTIECAICLDPAFKDNAKCCLLSNCTHVFHTECIKKWKEIKNNQIDCPLCRTKSSYFIPSQRYIYDEQRKKDHFDQLLQIWSTRPCKHWEKSHRQNCPFGYRCRFGHYDENGHLISKSDKYKHPLPLEIKRKIAERNQNQHYSIELSVLDFDDLLSSFHVELRLLFLHIFENEDSV